MKTLITRNSTLVLLNTINVFNHGLGNIHPTPEILFSIKLNTLLQQLDLAKILLENQLIWIGSPNHLNKNFIQNLVLSINDALSIDLTKRVSSLKHPYVPKSCTFISSTLIGCIFHLKSFQQTTKATKDLNYLNSQTHNGNLMSKRDIIFTLLTNGI